MRKLLCVTFLVACHSDHHDQPPDDGGAQQAPGACSAPLDRSTATDFFEAAQCLYVGPNAPQQGVTATLDPARIAIVHGRLLDDSAAPLAGATVAIAGHDEWGHTQTQSDGTFDLAVEGGSQLVVRFAADGRVASQRHVTPLYRRFAVLGDVTLRQIAAPVAVTLGTGSIVDGATSQDASGARSSALYFAPSTTATIDAPGGAQTLAAFHVHTTELTVGDHGPSAMPADLPPTSAYTYAIDFTVDEAVAAGAKHVTFDPPAIHYVDNFLHFPVGAIVPNGYFDADADQWIAGANGLVVAVTAVDATGAELDIDGDGVADSDSALAQIGITPSERATIGQRFTAGKQLWRVPIAHFSTWDHNWPYQPPPDALPPYDANAQGSTPDDCKSTSTGSIIGCDDQSLGEVLPIRGTPYALHYQSERSPGRTDLDNLAIQLAGATVPASLKRIDASIEVLGNVTQQSFSPTPNTTWQYTWSGTDVYGRAWQGRQTAHVQVGYVYDGDYDQTTSFSNPGIGPITGDKTRQEVTLWKQWDEPIGNFDATGRGLGGWTIDAVHALDATGGVLELGDGHTRLAAQIGAEIATVAGNGTDGSTGNGGPAPKAMIDYPHGLVTQPDGSVLFSEDTLCDVRKVAPDGTISTIAGIAGMCGFAGDGGPATAAQLFRPMGLALAPDGTLYIADGTNSRVRVVAPNGTISTFAGGGTYGPNGENGDGGPATAAVFADPHALVLGRDGSLYIADDIRGEIRKVAPNGTISTIAGGFANTDVGSDGASARSVELQGPTGIALGPNDELYIAEYDGNRVRRVDPAGTITTVMSSLNDPHTVAMGADGMLYITDEGDQQVLEVTPDGLVSKTIAGGGSTDPSVDDISPLQATFSAPRIVYVDRDGTLLVADWAGYRVRRIRSALPSYLATDVVVASQGGSELYAFDSHGRHLQTIDALTGAARLTAQYDAANRLIGLVDRAGNTTTIERAADGTPSAIVSPLGMRTTLAVDASGNLASVTDPAGATTTLTYAGATGLLTALTEPRGDVHRFSYDANGRLTSDANPSGLVKTLAGDATGVTMTAAGGTTTHVSASSDGTTTTRTYVDAAGLMSTFQNTPQGLTVTTPTQTLTATYAGDPRFGMFAPYAATMTVDHGGYQMQIVHGRQVTLADQTNPLSVQQVVDTTSVNGNAPTVTTYDAATRTRTTVSPMGRTRSVTLDAPGRVIAAQLGSHAPVAYSYDASGRVAAIAAGPRTYALHYDAAGRIAAVVDPSGNATALAHDLAGRAIGVTLPDGTNIATTYDANGNLLAVGQHVRTFGPGDQLATDTANGVTAAASYDKDGRLVAVVRPDGVAATIGYDAAGRVATLAYGGDVRTFGHDAATGQVTTASSAAETIAFGYVGGLRTQTTFSGAVEGYAIHYLDNDFATTELALSGATISFERDGDGLVTNAGDLAISRDGNGAVTSTELGGVSDTWTYDAYGDPASYVATGPTGTIYQAQLARDANGRIVQRTETVAGVHHVDQFAYDARGRLLSQTRDGAVAGSWTWSAAGERTSGGAAYDASYDANGAVVARTVGGATSTYAYDATGALATATTPTATIAYTTDPLGRRLERFKNGKPTAGYIYDDDDLHPVEQVDPVQSVVTSVFVYGARHDVPDYMLRGGHRYRIVSDVRGSVRLVIDADSGAIAQQLDYDAFGAVIADSNPGFQPFGFSGGLYDPDTGLVHFGAREYDPASGRFLTLDPSGLEGGLDPYLYANGDPINCVDPTGHFWQFVASIAVGAAIEGGLELVHQVAAGGCIDWGKVGKAALDGAIDGAVEAATTWTLGLAPVAADIILTAGTTEVASAEVLAEGMFLEKALPEAYENYSQLSTAVEVIGSLAESAGIAAGRLYNAITSYVASSEAAAGAAQSIEPTPADDDNPSGLATYPEDPGSG
ncbi:MAG TPA: RHS repeat-associated core domain-containing protein [Kofleriaceae bacterium]|nr:RHS repeat-associated core domain-containing protein [Kofleriaceae bacterium]